MHIARKPDNNKNSVGLFSWTCFLLMAIVYAIEIWKTDQDGQQFFFLLWSDRWRCSEGMP